MSNGTNRRALVIGAAGGMGTEVTRQLVANGYQVVASVLNDGEEAHVKKETPGTKQIIRLDLSNADGVLADLKKLALTSLDAVVVCAAIGPHGPVEFASLAQLRRTFEINTVAAAAIFQACMPALRTAKGRLVYISSFAGKVGLPFVGHYSSSKHALEGLVDVIRRETAHEGVKIILVEPGGVNTGMVEGQIRDVARDRAALSGVDAERFGPMYDGFLTLVKKNKDNMLHPSVVADTVMEALRANPPQIRYQVGDDAKFLCDAAKKPDAELEAIMASFAG